MLHLTDSNCPLFFSTRFSSDLWRDEWLVSSPFFWAVSTPACGPWATPPWLLRPRAEWQTTAWAPSFSEAPALTTTAWLTRPQRPRLALPCTTAAPPPRCTTRLSMTRLHTGDCPLSGLPWHLRPSDVSSPVFVQDVWIAASSWVDSVRSNLPSKAATQLRVYVFANSNQRSRLGLPVNVFRLKTKCSRHFSLSFCRLFVIHFHLYLLSREARHISFDFNMLILSIASQLSQEYIIVQALHFLPWLSCKYNFIPCKEMN